jgi:hypothetical protein
MSAFREFKRSFDIARQYADAIGARKTRCPRIHSVIVPLRHLLQRTNQEQIKGSVNRENRRKPVYGPICSA